MDPRPASTEPFLAQHGFVHALARQLVAGAHDAEDAAQDTLLAALRATPDPGREARPWLARVARNAALKLRRSWSRRQRRERHAARADVLPSAAEIAEREELRRRLVLGVLDLEPRARELVLLRFYLELPLDEVARRAGLSAEAARSRIRRALQLVGRRLGDDAAPDRRDWRAGLMALTGLLPAAGPRASFSSILARSLAMSVRTKVACSALIVMGVAAVLWMFAASDEGSMGATRLVADSDAARGGSPPAEAADPEAMDAVPFAQPPAMSAALPPSAASASGAIDVECNWFDAAPAERIGLRLTRGGPGSRTWESQWTETGSDGHASFGGLAAGKWQVTCSRGEHRVVDLKPAARAKVGFGFERTPEVTVSVCDPEGAPLAGAEILVAESTASWFEHREGVTGPDGRCTLRGLRHQYVGARHPEFVRSLRYKTSPERIIALRMLARGGSVEGEVIDTAGVPIAGAVIVAGGVEGDSAVLDSEGSLCLLPTTERAATGADGRFRLVGLPESPAQPLAAFAAGFGTWAQLVVVRAGEPARLRIVLERGVRLEGSVRDAEGKPVANAAVAVDRSSLATASALSDREGRFVLDGLGAGRIEVQASKSGAGVARASLAAVAGDRLRWDAVLLPAPALRGRIVDESGAGLEVSVDIQTRQRNNPRKYYRFVRTDRSGSFSFDDAPEGPLRLVTYREDSRVLLVDEVVERGGPDLLYVIDSSKLRSGTVTGRVVLADGSVPLRATVSGRAVGRTGSIGRQADPATGRFELGPLPQGRYEINVLADGFPEAWSAPHDLAADDRWDAGDIVIRRGGALTLSMTVDDPLALDAIVVQVVPEGRSEHPIRITLLGSAAIVPPLPPGGHVLEVRGPHVASLRREFTIREGAETQLALSLQAVR